MHHVLNHSRFIAMTLRKIGDLLMQLIKLVNENATSVNFAGKQQKKCGFVNWSHLWWMAKISVYGNAFWKHRVRKLFIVIEFGWKPMRTIRLQMLSFIFIKLIIDIDTDIPRDYNNWWLILDNLIDVVVGKKQTDATFTKYSYHLSVL